MLRFLLVLFLAVSFSSAVPAYNLELVQVIHRHGARSPIVNYNQSKICGLTYPCGILNKEGQEMLVNLGSFLRERYNSDTSVVSEPFFPQDGYNLSISTSRSTDVLRTLQSSDGFLRGLFPNLDAYYPAIHTVDKADDMLLLSNAIPEVAAKYLYGAKKESELCDPLVDALFPKFEVLQGIGAEVHSSGFCSERNRRTKCAMQLCDIGRAYQTTGTLRNYPKLSQYLTAVCEVLSCSTSYVFDYNRENAMDVARGTYGQPLAQQMIRNMRSHINQPTFKLYEYSAHDTTISPLAVTLGDSSGTMMEPPFASTFIVELLSRNQNYYVRLLFGHAGVTPSTNFQFGLTDFQMQCMKNGKSYIAENNVCPLEDFVEFIDFTKPTNPNGLCIVDPDLLEQMNCAPNVAPDQASELCLKYRHACPQEACGKDYISTSNKQCVPVVSSTPSSSGVSGWTIFFLMLLAFCAGAAALHFYPKALGWWHNRRSPEDEPVVV